MMNSRFHTLDVKRVCENKLGISFRSGKEYNGWFVLGSKKAARVTIPKGRKPIPRKTYKSMAKQLKLNIRQFDDLLSCPLDKQEYEMIIVSHIG